VNLTLHFLGVGSAQAVELGSSGAVLERDGVPLLLIDCGPETLTAYLAAYATLPRAVYVTHTHMDHVAGLERLFYRAYFDAAARGNVALYAQAALMPSFGPVLGKGDAMWRSLSVLTGDVVCFLDGDTEDFGGHFARGLPDRSVLVPGGRLGNGRAGAVFLRLEGTGKAAVIATARALRPLRA